MEWAVGKRGREQQGILDVGNSICKAYSEKETMQ